MTNITALLNIGKTVMARYLVIARQAATSPELLHGLQQVFADGLLFTWEEGGSERLRSNVRHESCIGRLLRGK